MKAKALHDFVMIPPGKSVRDLLPEWSKVQAEVHMGGPPQTACGACRKPFTLVRKPRKALKIYPVGSIAPVRVDVNICGACVALHAKGGAARDGVLAAVQAFLEGEEAAQ